MVDDVEHSVASECIAGDLNVDALVGFTRGARATLQAQEVKDYAMFTLRLHGRGGTAVIDRFGFEVQRTAVRDCAEFSGYQELDVHAARWDGRARSFMASLVDHVVACLGRAIDRLKGRQPLPQALELLVDLPLIGVRLPPPDLESLVLPELCLRADPYLD